MHLHGGGKTDQTSCQTLNSRLLYYDSYTADDLI